MQNVPEMNFDKVVRTVCSPNCTAACGVNAFVKDDRVVKLEPASYPDNSYARICLRGISMATQRIHHPDRLTQPMIRAGERGEGKWRKVSWEEAYDYIADHMRKIADEDGWRSNSFLALGGNYGMRSITATTRVANSLEATQFTSGALSSDFAGMLGYLNTTGSMVAANSFADVVGAKFFLSVGKNVADTGHSEMHFLFDAMERGLKFTMVDPRFSRSAAKADEWLPIRPGTDVALALGMIHTVISEGLMKLDYVAKYTNLPFLVNSATGKHLREKDFNLGDGEGYLVWDEETSGVAVSTEAIRPALTGSWVLTAADGANLDCRTALDVNWEIWKDFTPEYASGICEIPAGQIRSVARDYATAETAWMILGHGPQRYDHGHLYTRAFITLAALCGNIGKPYAGVSCYEGAFCALLYAVPKSWTQPGGRQAHSLPGTQLVEIIASGKPYPIRSLWLASFNFANQTTLFNRFVAEALPKLDLYVVTEQLMTDSAQYADVVLPCVSYYEDDWDLIGSMESWHLQLRRRAVNPVGESKNDFDIFGGICDRFQMGGDWWVDPEEACRRIIAEHPDPRINTVDWEILKRDGVIDVKVEEPYTPFRNMQFTTPSGRLELYQEQFSDLGEAALVYRESTSIGRAGRAKGFPLNLITYKHVHTTHTQHTILPLIQEVLPGPVLEISPEDAAERDIGDGDVVSVFNERGQFKVKASVSQKVRRGTLAMPQGFWKRHFIEGHPSDLGHVPVNEVQDRTVERNSAVWDIACNVRKA